jgi:anti-anti-sigma regulatory factor
MRVAEFSLPEALGIAQVHALHEQLELMMNDETIEDINIDASAVQRVDAAGVQLLYVLNKTAADRSLKIHWCNISNKLARAISIMGVAPLSV